MSEPLERLHTSDLIRDELQLHRAIKHATLPLEKLPIKLSLIIRYQLASAAPVIPYIQARREQNISFQRIAIELNKIYNTNLFSRNSVNGALDRRARGAV